MGKQAENYRPGSPSIGLPVPSSTSFLKNAKIDCEKMEVNQEC